ncbi:flavodoxin [Sporosarcina pasteurii]|nr:flavodoxin [Sporosarcina pasteurii]MDS9472415.1 flavodoxin [Sporosarcina pasteurii]
MVSFLIAYATYSGNTQEVAGLIHKTFVNHQVEVKLYRIGCGPVPNLADFDGMIIGSFTWEKGATPDEVKDFVLDVGYKPAHVYVFGTGDTQFGGDALFCKAAAKLAKFYHSTYPPLKIEQSPRGTQEQQVMEWAKGVMAHWLHLHA